MLKKCYFEDSIIAYTWSLLI